MTNGVEAVLSMMAFYFYVNLTYTNASAKNKKENHQKTGQISHVALVFDKNLALMTLAITVAFLIRSSSLIGWIPLAIFKIIST